MQILWCENKERMVPSLNSFLEYQHFYLKYQISMQRDNLELEGTVHADRQKENAVKN